MFRSKRVLTVAATALSAGLFLAPSAANAAAPAGAPSAPAGAPSAPAGAPSAPVPAVSPAVHACLSGGYTKYVRSNGAAFSSVNACVVYVVTGHSLVPKPTAKITGLQIFYVSRDGQAAAVTGTGFLPNTHLTFTVTFAANGPTDYYGLGGLSTDAAGAFNTGTSPSQTTSYISLGCTPNAVTVTVTDGTNTATGKYNTPACS